MYKPVLTPRVVTYINKLHVLLDISKTIGTFNFFLVSVILY